MKESEAKLRLIRAFTHLVEYSKRFKKIGYASTLSVEEGKLDNLDRQILHSLFISVYDDLSGSAQMPKEIWDAGYGHEEIQPLLHELQEGFKQNSEPEEIFQKICEQLEEVNKDDTAK